MKKQVGHDFPTHYLGITHNLSLRIENRLGAFTQGEARGPATTLPRNTTNKNNLFG